MADRADEKRSDRRDDDDDLTRGTGDEQIRGVASDEDEFEDTEDLDDEEEEEEGSI
jgi:hypothetical protein